MKRFKLLVFMLISFLCFGITNVNAADPGKLYVNNVEIIEAIGNTVTFEGGGSAFYDVSNQTLTLENARQSSGIIGIDAGSGIDLTIEVIGNNSIERIMSVGDLTIRGSGKLTIDTSDAEAILTYGNISISGVTMDLTSSLMGAINAKGNISIQNANISAKGLHFGLQSWEGNVVIKSSTLNLEATEDYCNAIYVESGKITIDDSDITAKSYYPAIFSEGAIEITSSTLDLTSTNDVSIFSKSRTVTILDTELNLDETKDFRNFATVSYITNADYSELDQLLKNVPSDLKIYTTESVSELNDIISSVVRTLTNQDQSIVDDYVNELDIALKNLRLVSANYSELDEALIKVPKELSKYTDESVKELNDLINSIDRELNIADQDKVDELVNLIEDAIQKLEFKPEENPKTFDEIDNFIILGVISLIGLVCAGLYTNRKRFN